MFNLSIPSLICIISITFLLHISVSGGRSGQPHTLLQFVSTQHSAGEVERRGSWSPGVQPAPSRPAPLTHCTPKFPLWPILHRTFPSPLTHDIGKTYPRLYLSCPICGGAYIFSSVWSTLSTPMFTVSSFLCIPIIIFRNYSLHSQSPEAKIKSWKHDSELNFVLHNCNLSTLINWGSRMTCLSPAWVT